MLAAAAAAARLPRWRTLSPAAAAWRHAAPSRGAHQKAGHVSHSEKNTSVPVVLLKAHEGLGMGGDVVSVRRGFMRNYLHPQSVAKYATPENMAAHATPERAERDVELFKLPSRQAAQLQGATVGIFRHIEAGQEQPSRPVTAANIAEKIMRQHRVAVSEAQVQLEADITTLSEHPVVVDLGRGFSATVTVAVEPR